MSRSGRVVRLDDFRQAKLKQSLPAVETHAQQGRTILYWTVGMTIMGAIGFGLAYLLGYFGSSAVAHWVS